LPFSINTFNAATFLALLIITADNVNRLEPAETYVVLLLILGANLALVPIYVWRLLSVCDSYWVSYSLPPFTGFIALLCGEVAYLEIHYCLHKLAKKFKNPTRYPGVALGALSTTINLLLLVAALAFAFWFWFARVPILDHRSCQEYAFVFGQVRLNSKVSVVLNIMMYFWLALVCLHVLFRILRRALGLPEHRNQRRRMNKRQREFLQNLDTWVKVVAAPAVTVAIELTILWNEIAGINSLAGASQTIPFAIGVGALGRVLYVSLVDEKVPDLPRPATKQRSSITPSRSTISDRDIETAISPPPPVQKR